MVDHGFGVIHTDNALGSRLHGLWSVPGVVDVLGREPSEDGEVASGRERLKRQSSFISMQKLPDSVVVVHESGFGTIL